MSKNGMTTCQPASKVHTCQKGSQVIHRRFDMLVACYFQSNLYVIDFIHYSKI
jgi:hypothetical protein